jgi:uncharacterized membrane protein
MRPPNYSLKLTAPSVMLYAVTRVFKPWAVPTSGINIRRRIVGFLFGASIPILLLFELWPEHGIVIKYIGSWKHILYLAIILGLIGFFIGDKYYDNVSNYLRRIKKYL